MIKTLLSLIQPFGYNGVISFINLWKHKEIRDAWVEASQEVKDDCIMLSKATAPIAKGMRYCFFIHLLFPYRSPCQLARSSELVVYAFDLSLTIRHAYRDNYHSCINRTNLRPKSTKLCSSNTDREAFCVRFKYRIPTTAPLAST
jgi:hypothetical protein